MITTSLLFIVTLDLGSKLSILMVLENKLRWDRQTRTDSQKMAQNISSAFPYLALPPGPGARFSKVPKPYGPFSGVTIPSVSQERREFEFSNFTVSLLFVTLKTF